MRYILFVIFICINGYFLFILSKKQERPFLLKIFPISIPVVVVLFFIIGLIVKLLSVQMNYHISQALISAMMSLIVIAMVNFANQAFSYMIDAVAKFHQKNNASNLGLQPVKFLIDHQTSLKKMAAMVWFLGAILMLYGIWLGDPH